MRARDTGKQTEEGERERENAGESLRETIEASVEKYPRKDVQQIELA